MKRYLLKIILIHILMVCCSQTHAQKFGLKPEDKEAVEILQDKYDDEEFVMLSSHTTFTFKLTKNEPSLRAYKEVSEQYQAIKDNASTMQAIFYDSRSHILELVSLEGSRDRPARKTATHKDYTSNGIFHDDVKICTYSIPLTTLGNKYKIRYLKEYFDVKYLTSTYFHEDFPIEHKTVSFVVPSWLDLELLEYNFDGFGIEKDVMEDRDKNTTTYTYVMEEIAAYKSERKAPRMAKDYPHILVHFKSYMEDGKKNILLEKTDDLYSWYRKLVTTVKNDQTVLKPIVDQLVTDDMSDIEKIEAVFYWVQDQIRYIAFEDGIAGFTPESAQNVCKKKYGDCKGMANLTKEMLKILGFDARLTWLGTNGIPYNYSVPSLAVDNHMICTVILKDEKYFLDPTEKFISVNDYAHRIQGRQVLIENGENYMLDHVPEFTNERNKLIQNTSFVLQEDQLVGKSKLTINGEQKTRILDAYSKTRIDEREEALKSYLTSDNKNVLVRNLNYSDFADRKQPLTIDYDLEVDHNITALGNEVYVNMDFEKEFGRSKIEDRTNDLEFSNKIWIETRIDFEIPEGHKVTYIPEPVNLTHEDFSFSLSMKEEGEKVSYYKKITVDHAVIKKKDFKEWNESVMKINNFYNDQLILEKQ